MENSPVLILKDHPFRTVSPSRIFTVQDSTLKSDSLGAGCLHGARSCSPLEAGNVSTIPGAGLDPAPLASSHHHTGTVNTSLSSSQECCDNASPPACVTEGQTVRAVCDQAAQTVDSDCECVKTGTPNVEPITNGHVSQEPEQPDCVFPFESRSHLVTTSPVPDWHQTLLDLPRIVKHKPSSITFSDSSCSPGIPEHFAAKESSDDGESSPREEEDGQEDGDEDDDDDVFSELPQSRELHVAYRQRRNSRGRQKRRGAAGGTADAAQMNSGRETSNKEVLSTLYIRYTCLHVFVSVDVPNNWIYLVKVSFAYFSRTIATLFEWASMALKMGSKSTCFLRHSLSQL